MLKYLIFFFFVYKFANGINWHTSQIILKKVYEVQNEQFIVMNDYLKMEMKRIRELERTLLPIFDWYLENVTIKKRRIRSHINNFKCMTKMFFNLSKTRHWFNNEQSKEVLKKLNETYVLGDDNLQSAYRSLRRIQRVYEISTSEMAEGIYRFKGRVIGDQMDACECFAMCEKCFVNNEMYGTIDWAVQTYNKWSIDRPKCVDIKRLQYYVKSTSIPTGFNYKESIFRELLNLKYYGKFSHCISPMSNDFVVRDYSENTNLYGNYEDWEVCIRFRNFCRTGKSTRPLMNNFNCRYQTKNSFYRILMPFKEEDVSDSPYMKLYHDILYHNEIETIIHLVENNLTDAGSYTNGVITVADSTRVGQLNWIKESNDELFQKLDNRVETITEFTIKTAEGYQIVNYGLGGHFNVHLDAFQDLSDVHDDGYTVFPFLNYVMHCHKGSALVWHNLHLNNGAIHSGTYHGGCPVIKGNKWIMTKGLYESGQNLTYDWRENKDIAII